MSLIRIDYENARAQARQLEQSEQQCSQIAQSIQALRQQLHCPPLRRSRHQCLYMLLCNQYLL